MKIRIYRTYTWELDCPRSEVRFGGPNPMKLVAHDELQYQDDECGTNWFPVSIMEGTKPKHPDDNGYLANVNLGDFFKQGKRG